MKLATDPNGIQNASASGACRWRLLALQIIAIVALGLLASGVVRAEQGDIVINNYSDKAGVRPVVFPHWFHRIRFTCKTCHADLGIKFKAAGNDITMLKIIDGQHCGACHNGQIAWAVENCNLCHSAKPGTPSQAHLSTVRAIGATPAAPPAKPQATERKP